MITYSLKVSILLAVFYLFYRLLLSKDTFHRQNRLVLLLTALLSFVLPLCVITIHVSRPVDMPADILVGELSPIALEPSGERISPWAIIFVIVALTRLLYVVVSYVRLQRFIASCELHPWQDGVVLAVTDREGLSPFSWMHTIVLPRLDYEHLNHAIITHEMGHIHGGHSWDVLFMELVCALQWYNPVVWMIRQDLRAIHEYEADEAVIEKGFNAHEYLDMLVTKAAGCSAYSMANSINNSTLKKRIQMMMKQKSIRWQRAKVLYVIPIIALSLACTSEKVNDKAEGESTPEVIQVTSYKNADNALIVINGVPVTKKEAEELDTKYIESITVLKDSTATKIYGDRGKNGVVVITTKPDLEQTEFAVYDVAEEMPEFPGGMPSLMKWIGANTKYPKEAQDAGVDGRVVVSFVVEKDGSIGNVEVVQPVEEHLDAEAVRVVKAMPKWKPGRKDGEVVRVKYSIPIMFRLQ